ncbi:MAG: electron transfer flavoprotein subunit beta/FixA family protein [Candidatus Omnitrophica bacterium]|nr:electron transfer flavoprotein subunit beta/FixA family protein [Candidatus Omnitrophota bacterium]
MNIVVCIKQVPDTNLQIRLNKDGSDIDRENLSFVMSPYDEFAVEEAIRIKEQFPDSMITVITLGPATAEDVLRQSLAMGADEAIHVLDTNIKIREGLITAKALAEVIRPLHPDLVLCGRQAVDDDAVQVGGALGELLGFPELAVACKALIDGNKRNATIERLLEGGIKQLIETELPCVITCQKGINEPRYPSLPGIMKAKKKIVKQIKMEELNIETESRILIHSLEIPTIQRKLHLIESEPQAEVRELIRLLHDEAKVI